MPSLQSDSGLPDPLLGGQGPASWSIFRAGSGPEHRGAGKGGLVGAQARAQLLPLGAQASGPPADHLEKNASTWAGSGESQGWSAGPETVSLTPFPRHPSSPGSSRELGAASRETTFVKWGQTVGLSDY